MNLVDLYSDELGSGDKRELGNLRIVIHHLPYRALYRARTLEQLVMGTEELTGRAE